MPELICELIISLDGFARGLRSPAYYGYFGPDFADWIETNTAVEHRMIIGRRSYEVLNGLPEEVRDEGWKSMTTTPGWLFSRTLTSADWAGLTAVHDDVVASCASKSARTDPSCGPWGAYRSYDNCSPPGWWTV